MLYNYFFDPKKTRGDSPGWSNDEKLNETGDDLGAEATLW